MGNEGVIRALLDARVDPKTVRPFVSFAIEGVLKVGCTSCADLLAARFDREALNEALIVTLPPTGDASHVPYLLEHGADANAKDPQGRTALTLAAASDTVPIAIIDALIRRGADVNAVSPTGENAVRFARLRGRADVVDRLVNAGAKADDPSDAARAFAPAASVRAAVDRSLPLMQASDVGFLKKTGCVSCHNNSLTAMAVALARSHDVRVDEEVAADQRDLIGRYIDSWRERSLQGFGIPGDADTISYILLGLAAESYPPDAGTDAAVRMMLRQQLPDGRWRILVHRPPIESNDIQVTAATLKAIRAYAPRELRATCDAAVQRAAAWLLKQQPTQTEERAFRLLGLAWSGASKTAIAAATRDLVRAQRPDGGWSQLASMSSDAYATGQALTALEQSGGTRVSDASYQKGVRFLLSTQLADGSWFVRSRAIGFQPYFESGFPHGRDQFISAAATAWATMALAVAVPPDRAR